MKDKPGYQPSEEGTLRLDPQRVGRVSGQLDYFQTSGLISQRLLVMHTRGSGGK